MGMASRAPRLWLSRKEKRDLRTLRRGQAIEARQVRRARIVLYCAKGVAHEEIARRLQTSPGQIRKWRGRFEEWGLDGLQDADRSGRPPLITPAEQVKVLGVACREPRQFGQARTLWSMESLARLLVASGRVRAISASSVWRILNNAGIKPHRIRMWCTSTDPLYDEKLADITSLYLEPPPSEPVLCIDEKTGMQALSRKHALKRARPGEVGKQDFEYRRNGTRCLFGCLNVRTGHVLGQMTSTRKSVDFLAFMDEVARKYRQGRVHVVLDNLNTHYGPAVRAWNARRGNRFIFHFTPTHGSWLNQIEIFFGILSRRVLKAASYATKRLLDNAVARFLRQWNEEDGHPFSWTYRGETLVA